MTFTPPHDFRARKLLDAIWRHDGQDADATANLLRRLADELDLRASFDSPRNVDPSPRKKLEAAADDAIERALRGDSLHRIARDAARSQGLDRRHLLSALRRRIDALEALDLEARKRLTYRLWRTDRTIAEIAERAGVSERQARRYIREIRGRIADRIRNCDV